MGMMETCLKALEDSLINNSSYELIKDLKLQAKLITINITETTQINAACYQSQWLKFTTREKSPKLLSWKLRKEYHAKAIHTICDAKGKVLEDP